MLDNYVVTVVGFGLYMHCSCFSRETNLGCPGFDRCFFNILYWVTIIIFYNVRYLYNVLFLSYCVSLWVIWYIEYPLEWHSFQRCIRKDQTVEYNMSNRSTCNSGLLLCNFWQILRCRKITFGWKICHVWQRLFYAEWNLAKVSIFHDDNQQRLS